MDRIVAASVLIGGLFFAGCGVGPQTVEPPTAEQTSQEVKGMISDFVEQAKKEPKSAAANLELLLESLESYATENDGPYVEIRDVAKELLELYGKSGQDAAINEKLDKLDQLGKALPGN